MFRSNRELLLHLFLSSFATIAASNPVLVKPAIELLCRPAAASGGAGIMSPRCVNTVASIGGVVIGGVLGCLIGLALKERRYGGGALSPRCVRAVVTIGAVVCGGIVGSLVVVAFNRAASGGAAMLTLSSSRCVYYTVITTGAVVVGGIFGRFVGLALKKLASGGTKKAGHVAIPDGKYY